MNQFTARNAIYLDFEGEGKPKDAGSPAPHMAGVFRPHAEGKSGDYTPIYHRELWRPVLNGVRPEGMIQPLRECVIDLIEEAESKGTKIVFWSIHEQAVVEAELPDLLDRFKTVACNLYPFAKKLKNRYQKPLDETDSKVLNQYLKAFSLPNSTVPNIHPGAAESCRRIDRYCTKNKRWRRWQDREKEIARVLVAYNRKDCIGLYRLARKVLWHL